MIVYMRVSTSRDMYVIYTLHFIYILYIYTSYVGFQQIYHSSDSGTEQVVQGFLFWIAQP